MANLFKYSGDETDFLANEREQYVEFYHLATEVSLSFKAFLEKFQDKYDPSWTEDEVFGRMDDLALFKRTKRTLSLSFKIPASTQEEAIFNTQQVGKLQARQYPTYDEFGGGATSISGGPLFRVKFLNLIQNSAAPGGDAEVSGLLGKISSFSCTPDLTQGVYDIEYNGQNAIFPKLWELSFDLGVFHEHKLGFTNDGDPRDGFEQFPYNANDDIEDVEPLDITNETAAQSNIEAAKLDSILA